MWPPFGNEICGHIYDIREVATVEGGINCIITEFFLEYVGLITEVAPVEGGHI